MKEKSSDISGKRSFIRPDILALSEDKLEEYRKSEKMKDWTRVFDEIVRYKPHTLSPSEEKVIIFVMFFIFSRFSLVFVLHYKLLPTPLK
jgi:oligoendopeptidase F